MKKLIALILALAMTLSLVACGSKSASAPVGEADTSEHVVITYFTPAMLPPAKPKRIWMP